METLGSMKQKVASHLREATDDVLITECVNDGVQAAWTALVLASLSYMVGGPVQNVIFAAGSERQDVVSIADPLVSPLFSAVASENANRVSELIEAAFTLVTESGSETKESPVAINLTVPTGQIGQFLVPIGSVAAYAQAGAIGWNLYLGPGQIGSAVGRRAKQNEQYLRLDQLWNEPEPGIRALPNAPAPPLFNTTGDDIVYIKEMEVQNNDGTYTRWSQGDIESELVRKASRTLASTSTYQPYVFDFVNQRTIELRPAAGTTLSPRFFYIKRPRRLRFDSAIIPLGNFPYEPYVKFMAISSYCLSIHEYQASQMWDAKAKEAGVGMSVIANMQNVKKVDRITPFM